jgi:DNA-binding beta-propeller fold protein YncE
MTCFGLLRLVILTCVVSLLSQIRAFGQSRQHNAILGDDVRAKVGPLPQGGFMLNSGWRINPAGKNIPLGTLPMSHTLSPDGRYLAVLNGGFQGPTISVIDLKAEDVVSRTSIEDGWRGLSFSASGDKLYAGNGGRPTVAEFTFSNGNLTAQRKLELCPGEQGHIGHLIGDVVLSRDGKQLLVSDVDQDMISLVDIDSGKVVRRIDSAPNPYGLLIHPDGKSFFATSWSTATVHQYRMEDGAEVAVIPVGAHPTEMVWQPESGGRLFVACANTNCVYVAVPSGESWHVVEKINVALSPRQPVGMTPSSIALSRDHRTIYVACSDANTVAVVDVSQRRSVVRGFIPSGWYPTAVRVLADGRLVVLNGKGLSSHPTPLRTLSDYVLFLQSGSALIVEPFEAQQLQSYTKQVLANSPYRDSLLENAGVRDGNPIPNRAGDPSPIKHVILLMKENRTYDQILGDMKEGNGDPSLVMFGKNVTPNHHKIAREFVLLDNFYVNADVSADGLYWTTAAIAPDTTVKTMPMEYAERVYGFAPNAHFDNAIQPQRGKSNPEGVRTAPGGHIWDKAIKAGVSLRNYGFMAINLPNLKPDGIQIQEVEDPVLAPYTNMYFRQHDRSFPDVERMKVIFKELDQWEQTGKMPQLILITIGNDHTEGTRPGACTPSSCVAENDQALGVLVERVSKSKFWPSTAIFVLEDDAQDGPDHVDSHRSPAFVVSPYTKRRYVDSTLYNTTSVLRTIELILGMEPMTVFDAGARPMANCFQQKAELTPYKLEPPRVALTDKNPASSPTAERSLKLDFSRSDLNDDRELNEILWLAIKGTQPPPPVRSRFSH